MSNKISSLVIMLYFLYSSYEQLTESLTVTVTVTVVTVTVSVVTVTGTVTDYHSLRSWELFSISVLVLD